MKGAGLAKEHSRGTRRPPGRPPTRRYWEAEPAPCKRERQAPGDLRCELWGNQGLACRQQTEPPELSGSQLRVVQPSGHRRPGRMVSERPHRPTDRGLPGRAEVGSGRDTCQASRGRALLEQRWRLPCRRRHVTKGFARTAGKASARPLSRESGSEAPLKCEDKEWTEAEPQEESFPEHALRQAQWKNRPLYYSRPAQIT